MSGAQDVEVEAVSTLPRLPAEILADIIELAILTSSPCPILPPSTLTLTLDTDVAASSFFSSLAAQHHPEDTLERVERAWLGNLSALRREGLNVDPIGLRLQEAGWYEECSGGFIIGHAYASRRKPRRRKLKDRVEERGKRSKPKQYRSVSVYWAEEQLVEEVSDPDRSSDDSDSDYSSDGVQQESNSNMAEGGTARSLPSSSISIGQDGNAAARPSQRRRSHNDAGAVRDPRIDRPHEPAWQTLYSRQRRVSPTRTRGTPSFSGTSSDCFGNPQPGPAEGDLDPWEMQDAQERLAALATSTSANEMTEANASPNDAPVTHTDNAGAPQSSPKASRSSFTMGDLRSHRKGREIYAYHLCTATLEPWINALFSSLRSLRLITLTFYPGHLLDDDKLEHMLRRILLRSECPRLETLLIRIVFDAASQGSRIHRFERTKTITGAVERIGDERVRVMLANARVGDGELVALPRTSVGAAAEEANPLSRKAITLTKEGWWSRVLQQNHHAGTEVKEDALAEGEDVGSSEWLRRRQERRLCDWQMFFPPHQHLNRTHLVNLIHHADAWPDHPTPIL